MHDAKSVRERECELYWVGRKRIRQSSLGLDCGGYDLLGILITNNRRQDQTCGSLGKERSEGRGEGENTSLLRIAGPVEKWTKVPIGLSQSFVWKRALTCGGGGLCAKRAEKGRVG